MSNNMSLKDKVCVVTGASKGIGKGIAVQLGQAGAKVYITGRSVDKLQECANEINKRGGIAVPVKVDHSNDNEVQELFEKIKDDNAGRLDVLVNNAYAAAEMISENVSKKFHEMDPAWQWDKVNGVGLRNHFICTTYAARIMSEQKDGLIVNVSSFGGLRYTFNVCYGVGKCALDRMSADCSVELKDQNVTVVSIWPGHVKTELIQEKVLDNPDIDPKLVKNKEHFAKGETVEFAGKAIAHLAADPNRIQKTGRILLTCDLAMEYGFKDEDGDVHDTRNLKKILRNEGRTWLAAMTPGFLRLPLSTLHKQTNKF